MPKSKQKKGHKKRVQNYLNQKKAAQKKAKMILMEQYQKLEEERMKNMNAQKAGADVENTDIDIDLDIDDIGLDMDLIVDDSPETSETIYQLILSETGKVGDSIEVIVNVNDERFDNSKIEEIKLSNKRIAVSDDNTTLDLVKVGLCKVTVSFLEYKLKADIEILEK